MKTNQIIWKKRIGTTRDSSPIPVPFKVGMPMLGGPIVTAGGVAFIGATADDYIRAFDVNNGKELARAFARGWSSNVDDLFRGWSPVCGDRRGRARIVWNQARRLRRRVCTAESVSVAGGQRMRCRRARSGAPRRSARPACGGGRLFAGIVGIAMRASILAVVALPCVSAHAQTSVSLYGVFDTSIEITNPGAGWVARMDSGAYRGSRVGVRGSEYLGDGLTVLFDLENGLSSADGSLATANTIFNRQAWIGLGSSMGTFRFGRQYSPIYIPFKGGLDAFGCGTIALGLDNLSKVTPYESNAITWISPDLHGISATLMAALRDGGSSGNGLGGSIETIAYRRGPFRVLFAHQQQNGDGALRANLGGLRTLSVA